MKKVLIFATLVFGMAPVAFAQDQQGQVKNEGKKNGTPEERAARQGEAWQKKLGLSDDEKSRFVEAKKTCASKIKELRKAKPVDKAAINAARTDFDNAIKAAFTPEHYAAWTKTKEEMKKKRAEKKDKNEKKGGAKPKGKGKTKVKAKDEKTNDSGTEDLEDEDDLDETGK